MANRYLYFPRLLRRKAYSKFRRYKKYKREIREDCQGRCVYCDAHENELGGIEFMTLDHFRPQDPYPHLANDPRNLLWSCQTCNRFKGNAWPAVGTNNTIVPSGGFVDPFGEDMHDYYDVAADGALVSLKHPADFMIRVMKLNREGAKTVRQKRRVEYEDREETLKFLVAGMRRLDDALEHPGLPDDLRAEFLAQKEEFCRRYDAILADNKPDFRLR